MWGCSSPACDLEELRIGSQDACWAPTLFLWDQFSHLGQGIAPWASTLRGGENLGLNDT